MELRHLRYFVGVAEELSFSRAALTLHVSQPALSRQIRDLEAELGRPLFLRNQGRISLTEAGHRLLEPARQIIAGVNSLPGIIQSGDPVGERLVRLGHFGTFLALYLYTFIQRMRNIRPGLKIDMIEILPAEALDLVREGKLDAALCGDPGSKRLKGLHHVVIRSDQPLLVIPANHAMAKKRSVDLNVLSAERWAIWDDQKFPGFGRFFEMACEGSGFKPRIVARIDELVTMYAGVAAGEYISYVGKLAGQHHPAGVVTLPFKPNSIQMPTLLLWRNDSPVADDVALLGRLLQQPSGDA